jgi:hypothetical protein
MTATKIMGAAPFLPERKTGSSIGTCQDNVEHCKALKKRHVGTSFLEKKYSRNKMI